MLWFCTAYRCPLDIKDEHHFILAHTGDTIITVCPLNQINNRSPLNSKSGIITVNQVPIILYLEDMGTIVHGYYFHKISLLGLNHLSGPLSKVSHGLEHLNLSRTGEILAN